MKRYLVVLCTLCCLPILAARANDWPFWRGPEQTGMTREHSAVTTWSQDGENLLWKSPIGGRTTPVLLSGRLYMIAPKGSGEFLQERVLCLDAETGKTIWEHAFNVFHTDIVEARLGWTSVVGDTETGNVYAHGTGGEFFCFDRDGRILWKWSLSEEFARSSGYGGRLHTPIIDEDRVIISMVYILTGWDTGKKKAGHRYLAFDKRTGELLWWSQPGGKPLDTTYSVPVVGVIGGKHMLIAANADGGVYGMLARTGERVWSCKLSKRGFNSSVVIDRDYAYVCHSQENVVGTEMGSVVCLDASKTGDIADSGIVWRRDGLAVGYSSPAIANGRLYVVTNSGTLHCLDAKTGKTYWAFGLGTAMKGSPTITADGVIYAGEVNGWFHILKDDGDRCKSLDVEHFERDDRAVVEINGSPIVAGGRVYFMTRYDTYCLGKKGVEAATGVIPPMPKEVTGSKPLPSAIGHLQLIPAEVTLGPGEEIKFRLRSFDGNGRFYADVPLNGARPNFWSVAGLNGGIRSDGTFRAGEAEAFSAGTVTITHAGTTASARIRISPHLPINESFDAMEVGSLPPGWIGLDVKSKLVEKDGSVVLQKLAKSPSAKYMRMRSYSGPPIKTGYTVQADLLGTPKTGRHATRPDMGLINSRYKLIMLGKEHRLRVVSYSPIPRFQGEVPFDWKSDVWYTAKLSVDVQGGRGIVRGKVWRRDGPEPDDWSIEAIDPCPNYEGSPGLYGYSKGTTAAKPGATIYYDNYRVTRND